MENSLLSPMKKLVCFPNKNYAKENSRLLSREQINCQKGKGEKMNKSKIGNQKTIGKRLRTIWLALAIVFVFAGSMIASAGTYIGPSGSSNCADYIWRGEEKGYPLDEGSAIAVCYKADGNGISTVTLYQGQDYWFIKQSRTILYDILVGPYNYGPWTSIASGSVDPFPFSNKITLLNNRGYYKIAVRYPDQSSDLSPSGAAITIKVT